MHAHPDPRRFAVATLGALVLTLLTLLLLSGVGSVDLSPGGSDRATPADPAPSVTGRPAWIDDPLAPPMDELRALPPLRP